ncbi:TrkH family potassium uptake protein [Salinispirillum marinum]|uniref:TrkH family potassium uptake protein n=2 Tax=Saccharospirillaceae TaxID=255527 RepID=A0ABV8BBV5_9GAMM
MAITHVVTRLKFWDTPGGALLQFFVAGAVVGTLLLALPFSRTTPIPLLDLLFTAMSAITVTGLITMDTAGDFTAFGQTVIAFLIQVGGLGYMLIGTLLLLGYKQGISLRAQSTLGVTAQLSENVSLFVLIRFVVLFSLGSVTLMTLILATVWWPVKGWGALGYGLFHAISAFNNAGFALYSDSLMSVPGGQPIIWLHAMGFIFGGLGFVVVFECVMPKTALSIHTRIMLYGTLGMLLLGTVLLLFFERNSPVLGEGSWRLTHAFFQAATTRTAGFNSVDIAEMSHASQAFMMINMVIGAGPGSTAGGIRLTTFVLLLTGLVAAVQGRNSTRLLGRTLQVEQLLRASGILVLTLALLSFMCILLLALEPELSPVAVIFEVVSALGTVGLSLGITGSLGDHGKLLIIVIMLVGKVSPVMLFAALAGRPERPLRYAGGNLNLG